MNPWPCEARFHYFSDPTWGPRILPTLESPYSRPVNPDGKDGLGTCFYRSHRSNSSFLREMSERIHSAGRSFGSSFVSHDQTRNVSHGRTEKSYEFLYFSFLDSVEAEIAGIRMGKHAVYELVLLAGKPLHPGQYQLRKHLDGKDTNARIQHEQLKEMVLMLQGGRTDTPGLHSQQHHVY